MASELDDVDVRILSVLKDEPEASQTDVAARLGISQPTVSKRIARLKATGALTHVAGVDAKRMGLHLAKVDIATSDADGIIDMLGECPFFVNGFRTTGTRNLTILLACDDYATLEAIVNHHIRPRRDASDVDLSIVVSSTKPFVTPMQFHYDVRKQAPCRIDCGRCSCWQAGRCTGCPVTGHYRGRVWKMSMPSRAAGARREGKGGCGPG